MEININYVLNEKLTNESIEINKKAKSFQPSEVDFDKGFRPHITLILGEAKEENVDKIINIVKNTKFKALNNKIEFQKPFLKGPYLMCEVVDRTLFKKDCDMLLEKLGDLIKPDEYLISTGNPPHVTLAYCDNPKAELKDYVESLKPLSDIVLKEVVVSRAGIHGTVYID